MQKEDFNFGLRKLFIGFNLFSYIYLLLTNVFYCLDFFFFYFLGGLSSIFNIF